LLPQSRQDERNNFKLFPVLPFIANEIPFLLHFSLPIQWSPTGKARGTYFTPRWGDIPAKRWRIHPRPEAVAFCCRGKF
jgi:hypothetical protein